jgi:hypothetical protein
MLRQALAPCARSQTHVGGCARCHNGRAACRTSPGRTDGRCTPITRAPFIFCVGSALSRSACGARTRGGDARAARRGAARCACRCGGSAVRWARWWAQCWAGACTVPGALAAGALFCPQRAAHCVQRSAAAQPRAARRARASPPTNPCHRTRCRRRPSHCRVAAARRPARARPARSSTPHACAAAAPPAPLHARARAARLHWAQGALPVRPGGQLRRPARLSAMGGRSGALAAPCGFAPRRHPLLGRAGRDRLPRRMPPPGAVRGARATA